MTGLDHITGALRLLGALATSETPSASEATDALNALNIMLDSWSNESLMIPSKVREVFPLTAGQQSYTMGSGGNFNTSRPIEIENALIQPSGLTPALELPLEKLTKDQFQEILIKGLNSSLPLAFYPEGTYPLETVNIYPVPSVGSNIVLYSWKPLSQITTLQTSVVLPPGYDRAIKYNLAIELAPEYGKPISDIIIQIAMESKANIKRSNAKPVYLGVDNALQPKSGYWNWMTGGLS